MAVTDINDTLHMAYLFQRLREPIFRSALDTLQLPSGSRGLDAGCGVGLQTLRLAEAVGPEGQVTGLDLSPDVLSQARQLSRDAGLAGRTSFREGDVRVLPFDDDAFDWAWSVDCVGYAHLEPLPLIEELGRVVKPGGTVAIMAWSSEMLLPGYPLLEARMKATSGGLAPFAAERAPESHFLRALGWFRAAGLVDCRAATFAGDVHAPLTKDQHQALDALFRMRWHRAESELQPEDRSRFQRLCVPGSRDYVLDHPDYYACFTYSMFHGSVPAG